MARQSLLGIGTYNVGANIDASATAAMMEGLSEWNGAENSASGAREESHGSAGGAAGTSADGGHHNAPSQASIWGHNHDAGSASWFMDFEAPSVPDFSGLGGVDAYGTLFGTGNGAGRGGLNGGH
ncbi:hypothetical protein M406DRAFT_354329 [Cryphonectria parasitica EP155]|uniref:Uncharacterized protein n=1 Tax=Cryphonectria parasitica (strain ATCC 38755 / EP155) TaxID=660469 RepID=A0A9P4YBW2_CRYP1|nr:uncharacterized protein M406DRAFT_354329 [Cryphonectria parasitica EP155]KAF3770216.1 hypothetical protein M406DRAFT_354329 [Cryphonectria parasitica EP155]